jgi:nitrogen regulatory protein P-II 1
LHQIEKSISLASWDVTGGNEKEYVYRGITYSTTISKEDISQKYMDAFFRKSIEANVSLLIRTEICKIFVSDIQETYRIRTKEKGTDVVS